VTAVLALLLALPVWFALRALGRRRRRLTNRADLTLVSREDRTAYFARRIGREDNTL